jgi:hypothetical protein
METAVVTGWFWVLYADTSTGCDLIARGVRAYPDPPAARAAARALADTGAEQVLSVQDADGCWRWRLYGDDGAEAAVSAGRFAQAHASYVDISRLLRVLRRLPLRVGLWEAGRPPAPAPGWGVIRPGPGGSVPAPSDG